MLKKEKSSYNQILGELNLTEDTLSSLENIIKKGKDKNLFDLGAISKEEFDPLQVTQKLRGVGLNSVEINSLASASENLKRILDEVGGIDNLITISPDYKVKQILQVTREEIDYLKDHIQKLEKAQGDITKVKNEMLQLQAELTVKHQAIDNQKNVIDNQSQVIDSMNKQLSDAKVLNKHLEDQLCLYQRNKMDYYAEKVKESYRSVNEGDLELLETRKRNQELLEELQRRKKEAMELRDELESTKSKITEMEQEIPRYYEDKIASLQEQIDSTVSKKQKELNLYCAKQNEQHRKEILVLQKRREDEILKFKQVIKEQTKELEQLRACKNPVMSFFKKAIT